MLSSSIDNSHTNTEYKFTTHADTINQSSQRGAENSNSFPIDLNRKEVEEILSKRPLPNQRSEIFDRAIDKFTSKLRRTFSLPNDFSAKKVSSIFSDTEITIDQAITMLRRLSMMPLTPPANLLNVADAEARKLEKRKKRMKIKRKRSLIRERRMSRQLFRCNPLFVEASEKKPFKRLAIFN